MTKSDAQQKAIEALKQIPVPESEYENYVTTAIASRISKDLPLTDGQIQEIKTFYRETEGKPKTSKWKIKSDCYGGTGFLETLETLKKVDKKVFIEAVISDNDRIVFANSQNDLNMKLVEIGHPIALGYTDRLNLEEALENAANTFNTLEAVSRWKKEEATIWHSTSILEAREQIIKSLKANGCPFVDDPPELVTNGGVKDAESVLIKFDKLRVVWPDSEDYETTLKPAPVNVVAANATRPDSNSLNELLKKLGKLEQLWLTKISSYTEQLLESGLRKVGKFVTSYTGFGKDLEPAQAAVFANAEIAAGVDVDRLIAPIIDDYLFLVQRATETHISSVLGAIQEATGVAVNAEKVGYRLEQGLKTLKRAAEAQLKRRVGSERYEPSTVELGNEGPDFAAPFPLTTMFAKIVGGGSAPKSVGNESIGEKEDKNPLRSIAFGVVSFALINSVLAYWRSRDVENPEPPSTDVFRPILADPPPIAEQTPDDPVEQLIEYAWVPDFVPPPREGAHFPAHVPHFGTVSTEPGPLTATINQRKAVRDSEGKIQKTGNGETVFENEQITVDSEPGDHEFCHCIWLPLPAVT